MFSFRKKGQDFLISAPIGGKLIKLEEVNDEVFSSKMMGDGFAILPSSGINLVVSPVDGEVVSLPDSKHAVGITTRDGIDVLVHVGIDTVALKGQGFNSFVKAGQKVKRGSKLLSFDNDFMKNQGIDTTVMTIITGGYDKKIELSANYQSEVSAYDVLIS
ncbi:PTS sugar transporter subunit IIA [Sedimentibacter sp. SX930]|nr:PTS sugar transporter subunit IIA [Sedimentibacter sp. SX930]